MIRLFIMLLLVCLFNLLFHMTGALNQYRLNQINEYLVDSVDTDSPEANYAAAELWFNQLQVGGEKELKQVLEVFLATRSLINDQSCSSNSIKIAQEACDALGSCSSRIKLDRCNRVNRLILSSVRSHARSCEFVYPKRYAALAEKLSPNVTEEVDKIGDSLGRLLLASMKQDSFDQVFNGQADRALNFVRSVYKLLFDRSLAKTLSKLIKDSSKNVSCADAYDELLYEPCSKYVRLLGSNLFDLAEYDYVLRDKNHLSDNFAMKHFYPAWLRYNICGQVMKSRDAWIRQIESYAYQEVIPICN